jgi:MFS family permease
VGGNLPVDSAIFLEACPATHQYLLTVLSIWWAFGQLIGALVAWPLIANYSCPTTATSCPKSENMGWRYFIFTMGGLMLFLWAIRFFVFKLHESPKFLMGRGRDEEAVENVHRIAAYNGKTSDLTVEDLQKAAYAAGEGKDGKQFDTSGKAAVLRTVERFSLDHVKALFATPRLAYSSTLIIILWGMS